MSRIGISFVSFFFLLCVPFIAAAGTTPNLTIGYEWGGTTVTEGNMFDFPLNQSTYALYSWPGAGLYGNMYGHLYKGELGQGAVLLDGHFLSNRGSKTEFSDRFPEEGDYFIVIFSVSFGAETADEWFRNGKTINPAAAPPVNWGIIRFKVGEPETGVRLYTQLESDYPSQLQTETWASEPYANGAGAGSCGLDIRSCGCALTSAVMIARFYDATTGADGEDMNPLKANAWMQENNGYNPGGGVNWNSFAKFANYKIKFTTRDEVVNNYALLDSFLSDDNPVIARADPGRGGSNQHFFVIDKKLAGDYRVKDPYWYNTDSLNEAVTHNAAKVRDYLGGFDALRVFVPHTGTPYASLAFALGSPAELLITDAHGRRLGKDPETGTNYNEIPGGSYGSDDFDNPEGSVVSDHRGKVAYITDPLSGGFTIKVKGTGEGPYTLKTTFTDTNGTATSTTHGGTIEQGATFEYQAMVNVNNVDDSHIDLVRIPLTVTADDKTILLGAALPSLTNSITGFIHGDTASSSDVIGAPECAISGTVDRVGTYPITCTIGTLTSEKYEFATFVPGVLTVTYAWNGFLQPIDDPANNPKNTPSIFKAGSTVPVKFQLKNASGDVAQASLLPIWAAPQKGAPLNATVDESVYTESATSGSTYRWDVASQQYIYNWSTKGLQAGYWYRVYAKLDDGKIYSVVVGLR